jgi:hypothetical protein
MPAENDIVKSIRFTHQAVINSRHQHRTGVHTDAGTTNSGTP